MAKTLTFEFPETDVEELEAMLLQMQRAHEHMKRDQAEINALKSETLVIATQTRSILDELEAAASRLVHD